MRYHDSGEVHKDFHLATNRTIDFIMARYDREFLSQLCQRTAQDVYRDIHTRLKNGESNALLEHLSYYTAREEGKFSVEQVEDGFVWHMHRCPMTSHIVERGQTLSPHMETFLCLLYYHWADQSPFSITVENYQGTSYDLCIRRRHVS